MDNRKFLLQIIRGQEPERRYIKLYEYQGDKREIINPSMNGEDNFHT